MNRNRMNPNDTRLSDLRARKVVYVGDGFEWSMVEVLSNHHNNGWEKSTLWAMAPIIPLTDLIFETWGKSGTFCRRDAIFSFLLRTYCGFKADIGRMPIAAALHGPFLHFRGGYLFSYVGESPWIEFFGMFSDLPRFQWDPSASLIRHFHVRKCSSLHWQCTLKIQIASLLERVRTREYHPEHSQRWRFWPTPKTSLSAVKLRNWV
jgi:hypothetical protein